MKTVSPDLARSQTGDGSDPVFLLGAPRSGTSLVYKALCLHPRSAFISQWVQRYPRLPWLAGLDRLGRASWGLQRRAWFPAGNAYVYGRRRPLAERLVPAPAEGETVFARAGISTELLTEAPRLGSEARALRSAFSSIQRWNGGDVLVVKRIANNRRVPLLQEVFPEARFIEIVRDGRAVALSISKVNWWGKGTVWWLGKSPDQWAADGGDPLVLCARHWVKEVETMARSAKGIDPERYLRVRYEDVVESPRETLKKMASFAGLDAEDPRWIERLGALDFPNMNQQWRNELDQNAIARIDAEQREFLIEYGYEVDGGTRGPG